MSNCGWWVMVPASLWVVMRIVFQHFWVFWGFARLHPHQALPLPQLWWWWCIFAQTCCVVLHVRLPHAALLVIAALWPEEMPSQKCHAPCRPEAVRFILWIVSPATWNCSYTLWRLVCQYLGAGSCATQCAHTRPLHDALMCPGQKLAMTAYNQRS